MFQPIERVHPAAGKASRGMAVIVQPRLRLTHGIAMPICHSWSGARR